MPRYTLTITADGRVIVNGGGVTMGPLTVHHVDLHGGRPERIVCKVAGHSRWGGRGQNRIYEPATLIVFDVVVAKGNSFTVTQTSEFPVARIDETTAAWLSELPAE